MKTHVFKMLASVCLAALFAPAEAATWWVDAAKAADPGQGTSAADALGTIQAAVDKAGDGDVIKVLPGTYDQGGQVSKGLMNRVYIYNKSLTLEATGSRDDTFIVGFHGTNSGAYSADNVRCVYANYSEDVKSDGRIRIKGFTLKGGGVLENTSSEQGIGGGFYGSSYTKNIQLVDCTIADCWASRGAGMAGGVAVRCLFVGNVNQYAQGAIAQNAALFNCIATGNDLGNQPGLQSCRAVNCTFFGNGCLKNGPLSSQDTCLRNCLFLSGMPYNDDKGALGHGPFRDLRGSVLDDLYTGGASEGYAGALAGFVTNAPTRQLFAPAFDDFRPMAGTVAATNGMADIMYDSMGLAGTVLPDDDDRYKDFYGNAIPPTGAIAAGAVQAIAPAAAGGAVCFYGGDTLICGYPTMAHAAYAYAHTSVYPAQIHLTTDRVRQSDSLFSYWTGSNTYANRRAPEMDESFYAMPPPGRSDVVTVGVVAAVHRFHVDAGEKGNDGNSGTDADHPLKTIRAAVEKCALVGTDLSLVQVAEGTYEEGESTTLAADHPTRLVVPNANTLIRFKGAGKGKTVLVGRRDAVTDFYGGAGPNAIRCAYFAGPCVLQGFTLIDGYAGNTSATSGNGGAVYADKNALVADCVITNSSGYRGSIHGGGYVRCEFYRCEGYNTMARNNHFFLSCQFSDCFRLGGAGAALYEGDSEVIVHCSSLYAGSGYSIYRGKTPCWNSVFQGGKSGASTFTADVLSGDIFYGYTDALPDVAGYRNVNPDFAYTQQLKPYAGSPVFTAGEVPTDSNYGTNYYRFATTDVNGRPLVFSAEGRPVVGCHQLAVSKVTVAAPTRGTIQPSGVLPLESGASVTFTYTPDPDHPNRPYLGIAVNGETKTDGTTYTLAAPADAAAVSVEALSSTNWYVNANAPDNAGTGYTPATAKKTLAGIMGCDILSGDCIHAARGVYAEGEMPANAGYSTTSRVTVPSGVTLVADEGPEVTVIRGQKGSGSAYGGAGSVRCAYLKSNAVLRGFMLADGNAVATSGNNFDANGGGVFADDRTALVYGCIVTNCAAYRSAGVYFGTVVNTRIVQNYVGGGTYGSAGGYGSLIGCYIDGQRNDSGSFRQPYQLDGCTLVEAKASYNVSCATVNNCVFKNLAGSVGDATYRNCVFDETSWGKAATTEAKYDSSCTKVGDLKLDANGRPQADSPVIGAGDNAYASTRHEGLDAAGNPRISNVTVDAGAFEYDYRPVFAAALGDGVTVTAASPSVTLEAGKVKLVDGASIAGFWPAEVPSTRTRYAVTAAAAGAGTLSGALVCADKVDERFALSNTAETRTFKAQGADIDFAFSYAGDGAGSLFGFDQTVFGMIMILR